MDQLSEIKRSKIKRANSQRLRNILVKFGVEQGQLVQMPRSQFLESVAKEGTPEERALRDY